MDLNTLDKEVLKDLDRVVVEGMGLPDQIKHIAHTLGKKKSETHYVPACSVGGDYDVTNEVHSFKRKGFIVRHSVQRFDDGSGTEYFSVSKKLLPFMGTKPIFLYNRLLKPSESSSIGLALYSGKNIVDILEPFKELAIDKVMN